MSAKTGTQFDQSAPMIEPPEVQGGTMISAPGSGLSAPTLITCGEYDEAPPWVGKRIRSLVRGSKLRAFPELSHMAHIENPAQAVGATAAFLRAARL